MSMLTHVIGFKPPDVKWQAMKEIWDRCNNAGVSIPKEVEAFFNDQEPDEAGVFVYIHDAIKDWDNGPEGMSEGVEVDLSKLPKDVRILRFYNSY